MNEMADDRSARPPQRDSPLGTNVKFRPWTGPSVPWRCVSRRHSELEPKKERRDGSSRGHEGLGLLPLKAREWRMLTLGLVRWKRGRRVQAGSAISRDRSSLLIALLRRRSDTRA
jgi:hypothetical protein